MQIIKNMEYVSDQHSFASDILNTRLNTTRQFFKYLGTLIIICVWLCSGTKAHAQTQAPPNIQHTENKADLALRSEARVDPSTLGMSISIPIASYPGRAGMGMPIAINYSSKVWRVDYQNVDSPPITKHKTWTKAVFAERSLAGWTSTLGPVEVEFTGLDQYYNKDGQGFCETCLQGDSGGRYYIRRMHVYLPDGSSHELLADNDPHVFTNNQANEDDFLGTFYAVDGSRMRYESGSPSVLYMPDGSRYIFPAFNKGEKLIATRYIDRHGNVNEYNHDAREWVDTLGRGIGNPLPAKPVAGEVTYYRTKLVGGGDSPPYIFRWKHLSEVLTVTDPDNLPRLHYAGDVKCGHNSYPAPDFGPFLFTSHFDTKVCVEREFKDWSDVAVPFNPVVLAEVELPTGNKYNFTYNVYGEIDRVVLPTGGIESFNYDEIPTLSYSTAPYSQTNRGVKRREVREDAKGSEFSEWKYEVSTADAYTVKVIPPDKQTLTERLIYRGYNQNAAHNLVRFGFDSVLAGRIYEERVKTASGFLLRRNLTKWEVKLPADQAVDKSSGPVATKQVSILFDGEGDKALAATTVTRYEQQSQLQNPTSVTEYDYDTSKTKTQAATDNIDTFNPPDSLAIRTTSTAYLDDHDYFKRGLVSLPSSVTVRTGMPTGAVVSFSAMLYDESRLPLLECRATVGRATEWVRPEDTVRGNATTTIRRLFKPDGDQDLGTFVQYDACGNARKAWDTSDTDFDNPSETHYDDSFSHFNGAEGTATFAFPTRTLTPDPDGGGSLTRLESKTKYDFRTGKVVSATDANNATTTLSYKDESNKSDPLNRLRMITQPDGGWTRYDYGNDIGNLFLRTRTAIDASSNTDAYQYFDGLGRSTRAFSYDGSAPERAWVASDTVYDNMMRANKVSNPYFVQTLGGSIDDRSINWTETDYDALGRAESVTTPDGARTVTLFPGNKTIIIDQTGKKRSSLTDGLGRLRKVIEAPGSLNYETNYTYDALGNLVEVEQGEQHRYFVYDSLSRLILSQIPEQGATLSDPRAPARGWSASYEYDDDGNLKKKTDARGLETGYSYDEINRITQRRYSDGVTPWVDYFYDSPDVDNSKGRLTQVKNGVSTYKYTGYDIMGRVLSSEQETDTERYVMSYSYDLAGNMRAQTYPSFRKVMTSYDSVGRLRTIGSTARNNDHNYASNFTYTAHGAAASLKLGNGLWEHTTFNTQRLQPVQIGLGTSATDSSKLRLDYTYGEMVNDILDPIKNNGNVQSQRIVAPGLDVTQNYTYDALNRLQAAEEAAGAIWKEVYKYDQFGNRNLDVGTKLPQIDLMNNPDIDPATNRIKQDQNGDNIKEYEYDAAGNLTRDALGRTFTYNANNMQIAFNGGANPQTNGASYFYDGGDRRVKKITASGTTVFIYDAMGKLVAEHTTETQQNSGGTKYLTTDTLGSPRVITDNNGAIVSRHDYHPFGEEILVGRTNEHRTDSIRQQFTEQERDLESKLDYFKARYYSYVQGRFTSIDPLASSGRAPNPQTWNRYAYVLNNPMRFIDPTGMMECPANQTCQSGQQPGSAPQESNSQLSEWSFDLWSEVTTGESAYYRGALTAFASASPIYYPGNQQTTKVELDPDVEAKSQGYGISMAIDIFKAMVQVDSIETFSEVKRVDTEETTGTAGIGMGDAHGIGLSNSRSGQKEHVTASAVMTALSNNLHDQTGRMVNELRSLSSPLAGHNGPQNLGTTMMGNSGISYAGAFSQTTKRLAYERAAREFREIRGKDPSEAFKKLF